MMEIIADDEQLEAESCFSDLTIILGVILVRFFYFPSNERVRLARLLRQSIIVILYTARTLGIQPSQIALSSTRVDGLLASAYGIIISLNVVHYSFSVRCTETDAIHSIVLERNLFSARQHSLRINARMLSDDAEQIAFSNDAINTASRLHSSQ